LQPGRVYTISTTTGQGKGTATSPGSGGLSLPYADNFDGYATGAEAKYLMDWQGAFEVAACGGGRTGNCVRQMSAQAPITWDTLTDPHTLIGDTRWNNYTVTSDVLLEKSGYAELMGRVGTQSYGGAGGVNAYHLRVSDNGAWSIIRSDTGNNNSTLASGNAGTFGTNAWHTLSLGFSGSTITAGIDGKTVGTANDSAYGSGQAGYATSQGETAQFDNLAITAGAGGPPPPPPGTGPLHAVGAGKCLDDPNSSTSGGTQQDIQTCNGQANQTWSYTASGQLNVTVGGQTLCLDANGQGTTNGTKAIIWSCNGGTNQQWNLNSNGTITGVQSGLCLDVTGASTANGALVELWSCNGGSNQQWTLG